MAILTVVHINISGEIGDNPEKIWLHRVNSFDKLLEKEFQYPNFEVDVVFRDKDTFDVTHDIDVTFHQSLLPYFADISKDNDRMWLDVKNLDSSNALQMKHYLDSLCERYGVAKKQLIIESRSRCNLQLFTDAGYYTSYYVDFPKPVDLCESEIDSCIQFLRGVADSGQVKALSFPGWWYADIHEKLNRPIDLLTWKHRTTEYELRALPLNREMLHDSQVKVILVKSKGKYHR